jgi:transposase-like protein
MEEKERYLIACYSAIEAKEFLSNFGMRLARDYQRINAEVFPAMYEIELDVLMRPSGPWGWVMKEYDKREDWEFHRRGKRGGWPAIPVQKPKDISGPFKKYSAGKMLGNGLTVDKRGQDDQTETEAQIYKLKMEACPNPKCTLYGKSGKGNIVSNGTYRMKEGALSRRFLCKECGEFFCSRAGSIFYGLRSPEERILEALKLLTQGIPLKGVAKTLGVEFRTVQRWLEVAAEQRGRIDDMLIKKLKVSQVELDTLWGFVKENSLRQRATL